MGLKSLAKKNAQSSPDEYRKGLIRGAVQDGRRALASGLESRLAGLGIFLDSKRIPIEDIPDQWVARRERPWVEAALGRWKQQGFTAAQSVERFIREASYTWLNRLAAIRALEARGLSRPIASLDGAGARPSIVASLADVSPVLAQARELAEALLWQCVFDEFALQLGALFDPYDPHGMLFPGSTAVLETLQAFDQLDNAIWNADDTLGWFYQFFTTKDERAKLRKKKGPAFTADDLGPINQFYTPDWIVRFLVDNTLGALWRRMRPETAIGEFCTLLLPATDDDTPKPLKRVREIKLIDPACGAMHFGVYAFDVLQRMYAEEGIENPRDVPRLILEHNIVGIDIDRRAIQIAALNLYLKAARASSEMGLQPPQDLRLNLGCADAAPPSGEQIAQLRAGIDDPALRQAFEAALSSLTYLHAVGSLLDVEADVRSALAQRAMKVPDGVSPLPGLLAQVGMYAGDEPTQLDAVVTRARHLAEAALRADDVAGALAAEDALLAAKVLELVGQRYDVVVMNPPYGELMPPATKQYLHRRYPKSKSDLYGAFFELAFRLAEGGGAIGALTSKTFLYLDTFKHVRELFLETGRMSSLIDGGHEILFESNVDVSAIIGWMERPRPESRAVVVRLVRERYREQTLQAVISELRCDAETRHETLYRPTLKNLRKLPTRTIAYWAPPALLRAYEKYPPLEPTYGEVRVGLQTGDDERFLRFWWEVPADEIGVGKRWVPFAKGGEYSPYYESLLRVIDWKDDGKEIIQYLAARPQNRQFYFREGLTFPNIADRFHARALPPGSIFGHKGSSIFSKHQHELLGFLNSRVAQVLLMAQSVTRLFEVGQVRRLCVPSLESELGSKLREISTAALTRASEYAEGDERDPNFRESWAESSPARSLTEALDVCISDRNMFLSDQLQAQSDSTGLIGEEMGFTELDWEQITNTFGPEIGEDKGLRMRGFRSEVSTDPLATQSEHARRLASSLVRRILHSHKIADIGTLTETVEQGLISRFPVGDPVLGFAQATQISLRDWLKDRLHLYHHQLLKGRPYIIRLASRNGRVIVFVDALRLSSNDLRTFSTTILESQKKNATSLASIGSHQDRLNWQEVREDTEYLIARLESIANVLDGVQDVRRRMPLFFPLAPYLERESKRRGNAR